MSGKIKQDDMLKLVSKLAEKDNSGTATTKDIAVECGIQYPDVHIASVLTTLREMKQAGFVKYEPSAMIWRLTEYGKRKAGEYD